MNYKGIGGSSEFELYRRLTKELVRIQLVTATREEKLAFFINIYNALVIHANVTYGPPSSLWQRYKFFNTVRYIIGGYSYSLQDIENGVLRGNKKGMGMCSSIRFTNAVLKNVQYLVKLMYLQKTSYSCNYYNLYLVLLH